MMNQFLANEYIPYFHIMLELICMAGLQQIQFLFDDIQEKEEMLMIENEAALLREKIKQQAQRTGYLENKIKKLSCSVL